MIEDEFEAWIEYRRLLEGKDSGDMYDSDLSEEEVLDEFGGLFDSDEQPQARPAGPDEWREMSLEELIREAEQL